MRIKIGSGLLPQNLLVIILIIIVIFVPSNIFRIILGLPLVLLFPGHALMLSLLPNKGQITIYFNGDTPEELGPVTLAHEEKWEHEIGFAPKRVGENQKVEFLLFKGEKGEPYRSIHFWVNVKGIE